MTFLASPAADLKKDIYHHLQYLLCFSISVNTVANKPLYKNICINKAGSVNTVKEKSLKNVNEYSPCSLVASGLLLV